MLNPTSLLTSTRLPLLAGASLLMLAACGGGDDDTTTASRTAPAEPTAASEPAAPMETAEVEVEDTEMAEAESMDDSMDSMDDSMDMDDDAEAMETADASAATSDVEANGTVHEIQMLNRDPENAGETMVFEPDLLLVQPGDTVRFVPTDPSHQSSSVEGMVPDGVDGWEGQMNQPVEFVVSEPGVYGARCVPHYAAGMVALIVAEGEGMTDNVEQAKSVRHVGLASRRFEDIWARAEEQYLNGGS